MSKLGEILELLSDGDWHPIGELGQMAQLDEIQTREVTSFLLEYNLAELNVEGGKLKLTMCFKEFLGQVVACEGE